MVTISFKDVHLYTVRVPGLQLLGRYAKHDEPANDWFERIVSFNPEDGKIGIA